MANGKVGEKESYVLLRGNRRKHLRKQLLVLKIKGEGSRGSFFGYAKTVSKDGMFIASVNPHRLGEEFQITFKIPETDIEAKCSCVVIWRREFDPTLKREPGMGINFIDLDYAIREKIEEWIKKT